MIECKPFTYKIPEKAWKIPILSYNFLIDTVSSAVKMLIYALCSSADYQDLVQWISENVKYTDNPTKSATRRNRSHFYMQIHLFLKKENKSLSQFY